MSGIYRPGERVRLVRTTDPYTHLQPGDRGTVLRVDDAGTVHIAWDCGSTLGMVPGEDHIAHVQAARARSRAWRR